MADALVTFKREDRDGVVAVGSYLIDVIKRFGIPLSGVCDRTSGEHHCTVTIVSGAAHLSSATDDEKEHFAAAGRTGNVRLACETKITRSGEIVVMTEEKTAEPKTAETKSKLVDEFEALPLEKKIADLLRMEAVALGETFSFVVNSPLLVFEKVGDVLAEFGMKLDREAKEGPPPTDGEKSPDAEAEPKAARQTARPRAEKRKPAPRRPRKSDK